MDFRDLLLRAYPRSWREEYGEELAGILARRRLTPGVVADVLGAAARQHLYRDEPRWICGAGLCVWTCLGLALDHYSLLILANFPLYNLPVQVTVLGIPIWTVLRRNTGAWEAMSAAYWAAITGIVLPELLAWFFWGRESRLILFQDSHSLQPIPSIILLLACSLLGKFLAGLREGLREGR